MAKAGLWLSIFGDPAGGVSALRATRTEADLLANSAAKSSKGYSSALGSAEKSATGFQSTATKALSAVGISTGQTGTALGSLGKVAGPVLAGAAIAKFSIDSVQKLASLTGEVRQFQRVSLTSAEDASKLVFTVKRLGIEPEAASKSVGMLAKRIGDGTVDLDRFGIATARNADGTINMGKTLENVSDKFRSTHDASQQAAMGQQLFGRSWQTLLPLLRQGSGELEKMFGIAQRQGLVFKQEDLDKAVEFSRSMKDLKSAFEGVEISVGRILMPTLTQLSGGLTSVTEAANSLDLGDWIANNITNGAVPGIGTVTQSIRAFKGVWDQDWQEAWKGAVSTVPGVSNVVGRFTDILEEDKATVVDWGAKFQDAQGRVQKTTPGTREHTQALHDLREASGHVATQQGEMAKATEGAGRNLALEKLAADPLTASLKDVAGAEDGLATEEFKVGNLLEQRASSTQKVGDAHKKFMEAVAGGNVAEAETSALTAAASQQQSAYADTLLRTKDLHQANQAGAAAYALELRGMASSLPPDSPLRARLELDLALMQSHHGKVSQEQNVMYADIAAITATGGQNVVVVEAAQHALSELVRKNHHNVSAQEEQFLQNDLGVIAATGGRNRAAIDKFWGDFKQFQNDQHHGILSMQEIQLGQNLSLIAASNNNAWNMIADAENNARDLLGATGGARYAASLHAKLEQGITPAEAILQAYNEVIAAKGNELIGSFGGSPVTLFGGGAFGSPTVKGFGITKEKGGVVGFEAGGCVGCGDPNVAQIAPAGAARLFAEESRAGREAYVPQKGINDDRAGAILNTAAGWYGMRVTAFEDGGAFGLPLPIDGPGWDGGPTIRSVSTNEYFQVAARVAAFKAMHDAMGMGGGTSTGPWSGACADWVRAGITAAGKAATDAEVGCGVTVAGRESGCNPNAINNWDSNAARGTPSIGLMQTIGPTFSAYGGGDIRNPVDNVRAATNYAYRNYGSWCAVAGRPGGYELGGVVSFDDGGTLAPGINVVRNDTGRPEVLRPVATQRGRSTRPIEVKVFLDKDVFATKVIQVVDDEGDARSQRRGSQR